MKDLFAATKPAHWSNARYWLFYTVVFGALPFWGSSVLIWLSAESFGLALFVKDAQLAVYAAGLLAASIPAMQKEVEDSPYKHPKWFLGLTIFVIVIAALVFGGTATSPQRFKAPRLATISIVLTVAALTLGFLTELVSSIRDDPDLWGVREAQVNSLAAKVRQKMEKGDNA